MSFYCFNPKPRGSERQQLMEGAHEKLVLEFCEIPMATLDLAFTASLAPLCS